MKKICVLLCALILLPVLCACAPGHTGPAASKQDPAGTVGFGALHEYLAFHSLSELEAYLEENDLEDAILPYS